MGTSEQLECQRYLVSRRGPGGKWSHLSWQPKLPWAQAGPEQPGCVPKVTSFTPEKLSCSEELEQPSEGLTHHTCTCSSKPAPGYH